MCFGGVLNTFRLLIPLLEALRYLAHMWFCMHERIDTWANIYYFVTLVTIVKFSHKQGMRLSTYCSFNKPGFPQEYFLGNCEKFWRITIFQNLLWAYFNTTFANLPGFLLHFVSINSLRNYLAYCPTS